MAYDYTPAQQLAINTRNKSLLVSAAAGSGKTATLTERIIRSLTDSDSPADISRMLVATFTRASAADLRVKISAALSKKLEAEEGKKTVEATKKQLENQLNDQKKQVSKMSLENAKLSKELEKLRANPEKVIETVYEPSPGQIEEIKAIMQGEAEARLREEFELEQSKKIKQLQETYQKNERMQDSRVLEVNVLLTQVQTIFGCISYNLNEIGDSEYYSKIHNALDQLLKNAFGFSLKEA